MDKMTIKKTYRILALTLAFNFILTGCDGNTKVQTNKSKEINNKEISINSEEGTNDELTKQWVKDLQQAKQNNVDFVIPKGLKDIYVSNNYALLLNEIDDSDQKEIKNLIKSTSNNAAISDAISNNVGHEKLGYYLESYYTLLGIKNELDEDNDLIMKAMHQANQNADNLINNQILAYSKEGDTIEAIYSLKSFNDSKGVRDKFNENPVGWPSKNRKLKDQKITNKKTYSGYLWNRSHIIADRFGGKANAENSTTGTRAQNVGDNSAEGGGMLFMENALAKLYQNGSDPFYEVYLATGLVPIVKVSTRSLPDSNSNLKNIVNLSNASIILADLDNMSYEYLIDADDSVKKKVSQAFSYVYSKKYEKQNKFYDALFEVNEDEYNGAYVIVPNMIKGLEFSYSGEAIVDEAKIRNK